MRDPLGNVTSSSKPLKVRTEPEQFRAWIGRLFRGSRFPDRRAPVAPSGTVFSGKTTAACRKQSAFERQRLRLESSGTVWDGGPRQAFSCSSWWLVILWLRLELSDYAGLATRRVPGNNDGGLMVRVAETGRCRAGGRPGAIELLPDLEPGQYGDQPGRRRPSADGQSAGLGCPSPTCRSSAGALDFHFRTSADGQHWEDMPGSPVRTRRYARPTPAGRAVSRQLRQRQQLHHLRRIPFDNETMRCWRSDLARVMKRITSAGGQAFQILRKTP